MWENDMNINEVREIRTRTSVYFGVGAIRKINDIAKVLKEKGINKVIVMSGRNAYKATGAWDYVEKALKDKEIGYINYDQVTQTLQPTTLTMRLRWLRFWSTSGYRYRRRFSD